jgi:methylenetetrahydrofolate--tRNA-(uracil-5-)-methyltransferase
MRVVNVVGAGLAGCEAAFFLKERGFTVRLWEAKPAYISPAHSLSTPAELVCSNALGAREGMSSSAFFMSELKLLGSKLLQIAEEVSVPAGRSLAVERERFSRKVALELKRAGIEIIEKEITDFSDFNNEVVLIATGPMTSPALLKKLAEMTNSEGSLYYFDASSPIVTRESLTEEKGFWKSRYEEKKDYFNAPLNKEEYLLFREALLNASKVPLKEFEEHSLFEACLPIEELAARGEDTMRFGPLKPVGLEDPRTQKRPWAVLQLRQEDAAGNLLNLVGCQTRLKWGEQKRVFRMIPALEKAEFVRYGVMHKNTFLNSPQILLPTFNLKNNPRIYFAGQITGTEGYAEAIGSGIAVAFYIWKHSQLSDNSVPLFPTSTLLGSLLRYVVTPNKNFQPMKANLGLLEHPFRKIRKKRERKEKIKEYHIAELQKFKEEYF